MFLSIIIPVYNTASYLQACFDSLFEQNIDKEEYEIIVVNDGSTDQSLPIIEENKGRFAHFTLINQKNAGQSAARNRALQIAQGNYIWFVDSDDYIEHHCLLEVQQLIKEFSPDVFTFCADEVGTKENKQRQHYHDYPPNSIMSGCQFLSKWQYRNCVPFYVFNRMFFTDHSFHFTEGIIHEDNELLPRVFYVAKQVFLYDKVLYHINLSQFSTMRSNNSKRVFDLWTVAQSLTNFMNNEVTEEWQPVFARQVAATVNASIRHALKLPRSQRIEIEQLWYKDRTPFLAMKRCASLKYRIEGFFLSRFPIQTFQHLRLFMFYR